MKKKNIDPCLYEILKELDELWTLQAKLATNVEGIDCRLRRIYSILSSQGVDLAKFRKEKRK